MKNLRTHTLWYLVLASVALAAAVSTTGRRTPWESSVRAQEQEQEQATTAGATG